MQYISNALGVPKLLLPVAHLVKKAWDSSANAKKRKKHHATLGHRTSPLTSSCVSERKKELTPMMKGVGVLRTSRSFPGRMGT